MPLKQQQIECYSLPTGHSLCDTHMCPEQVYLLVHGDMDLSRQLTHPGPNNFSILEFHSAITSQTGQNEYL